MTTVFLVRHASAGERSDWTGDDRLRPLDERGRRQAEHLAEALAGRAVDRILTSPFLRCRQTVEPLGRALGVQLEDRPELAEGAKAAEAVELARAAEGAGVVLCTHGDVVLALLGTESPKGSIWVLDGTADGSLRPREYLAPGA